MGIFHGLVNADSHQNRDELLRGRRGEVLVGKMIQIEISTFFNRYSIFSIRSKINVNATSSLKLATIHPGIIAHLMFGMLFHLSARSPPPASSACLATQQEPASCTSIFNPSSISIPRAAPVPVRGTATCSLCEHAYNPDALFSYLSSSRI